MIQIRTWVEPGGARNHGFLARGALLPDPLKQVLSVVFTALPKTGECRWIEDRVVPQTDDSGRMVRILGVARDVTERGRADDVLRETEAKYRTILDHRT